MTETDQSFSGKARRWQANVSVAASGPDYTLGIKTGSSMGMYPKVAAELQYTSADIAFLSTHWRKPAYQAPFELHVDKYDCEYSTVMTAMARAGNFLSEAARDAQFDGGSVLFAYSGHGREGDGTLCLRDKTFFSADDLIDACLDIRHSAPERGRLRLALLLESCHSGAFMLRVLERLLHEHSNDLVPEYFLASSMPDEYSFELPVLGHGLSTFCFSVSPLAPGSMIGSAAGIPVTWAVAAGPGGCSLVSGGLQNPIVYDGYELKVAERPVRVWLGDADAVLRSRQEWESDLVSARDELRRNVSPLLGLSYKHMKS